MKEKEIQTAKKIINREFDKRRIKILKIILFGSRARGDYRKGSDWDFLVVIKKKITFHDWSDIYANINRELIKYGMPADIIIRTESEYRKYKNCVGDISYYSNRDGVAI